jgi:hypothetical protein
VKAARCLLYLLVLGISESTAALADFGGRVVNGMKVTP